MAEDAVGFIGLGLIGAPLARVLRSRGTPLVVNNRTAEKAGKVLEEGAVWAASPEVVGRESTSGIVFLCLAHAEACSNALWKKGGLVRGLPKGGLVVNLSTIAPDEARELERRLGESGLHYAEAPIGGSIDAAAQGQVLFYAGGSPSDLDRAQPYLERMGKKVLRMGPVGAGTAMKIVNNILTIGTVTLLSESLALAEGLGLDLRTTVEILLEGGGRSQMLLNKQEAFLKKDYTPKFFVTLAEKDLRLAERSARLTGKKVRMVREARRLLEEAEALGLGESDFSAAYEAARSRGRRGPRSRIPIPL
jgi:3-hydroxyisobutyrate dehydrogenase-like beta-hydroxyacid dehydrogenase